MTPLSEAKTRLFAKKLGYYMPPIDFSLGDEAVQVFRCSGDENYIWSFATVGELWGAWARHAFWLRSVAEEEDALIRVWKDATPRVRNNIMKFLKSEHDVHVVRPWTKQHAKVIRALPCMQYNFRCMPRGWRVQFVRDVAFFRSRATRPHLRLIERLRLSNNEDCASTNS